VWFFAIVSGMAEIETTQSGAKPSRWVVCVVVVWMLGVMVLSGILHEGPFVTSIIKRVDKRAGEPVLKQKWETLAEWFGQQPEPVESQP